MNCLAVSYSKGQLKIQEMAFVLVALVIFFAIAGLFYFSVRYASLKEDVESLRGQETLETVRKIAGTAEFSWSIEDCSSCVDFDKILTLKNRTSYKGFWKNIAFLQIQRIFPTFNGVECTLLNYPNCDKVTLVQENERLRGYGYFVALCRYDELGRYNKCSIFRYAR